MLDTNRLPQDPVMLLSVVNTKLRDHYGSLSHLCDDMQVDEGALVEKLKGINYLYNPETNQFI